MQRSKYDPPEYRDWTPDPEVVEAFATRVEVETDAERARIIHGLSKEALIDLYAGMVRFRLFDTMLARWVRGGIISKAWLGTGEEAVSVGCARALRRGDMIGPMIRNAGACFEMGMAMGEHFAGYLGTAASATRGRDVHVGDLNAGVVAPISHVGSLLPVMCGLALAFKRRAEPRVAMTWVGDGATRTGEIHEAVNFAAVAGLPIVIVVQDNQVAMGTKTPAQAVGGFDAWLRGYGLDAEVIDGNHVLEVYAAASLAVGRCREGGGPAALVARTFRMGGHATHDEAIARRLFSDDDFRHWGKRDPIGNYGHWLVQSGRLSRAAGKRGRATARRALDKVESEVNAEVEAAAEAALAARSTQKPDPSTVANGVYAK